MGHSVPLAPCCVSLPVQPTTEQPQSWHRPHGNDLLPHHHLQHAEDTLALGCGFPPRLSSYYALGSSLQILYWHLLWTPHGPHTPFSQTQLVIPVSVVPSALSAQAAVSPGLQLSASSCTRGMNQDRDCRETKCKGQCCGSVRCLPQHASNPRFLLLTLEWEEERREGGKRKVKRNGKRKANKQIKIKQVPTADITNRSQ